MELFGNGKDFILELPRSETDSELTVSCVAIESEYRGSGRSEIEVLATATAAA